MVEGLLTLLLAKALTEAKAAPAVEGFTEGLLAATAGFLAGGGPLGGCCGFGVVPVGLGGVPLDLGTAPVGVGGVLPRLGGVPLGLGGVPVGLGVVVLAPWVCIRLCLGLWRAWLANSAHGFALDFADFESCLGKTTFMGGTAWPGTWPGFLLFKSSSLPGFLGEALLGLSTLASLHSVTRLLLGVMVTVPGLS